MEKFLFVLILGLVVVLLSGCTSPTTDTEPSANDTEPPANGSVSTTKIEIQLKDVYERFENIDGTFLVNFEGDVIEGRVAGEVLKGSDDAWSWSTYYKRYKSDPEPIAPLSNKIAFPFAMQYPDISGSTSNCLSEDTEIVLKLDFYDCEDIKNSVNKSCFRISVEDFKNAGIKPVAHAEKTFKIEGGPTMDELLEACNGDVDCLKCNLYKSGCYPFSRACE